MPSDAQDLQVVLDAQQKRDMAPNVTSQVVNEMKNSLIFQMNWEELLQSAPTAISCMGACFVASSSPKAVVMLKPREGKPFTYLKYTSIQANLTECGNLGRFAFIEAESGMGTIQMTSQIINGKINQIVQCLGDPLSAKKLLKPQLNALKNGAQQCLASAMAIDKKFGLWLLYVCEMHAACVEEEYSTRDQLFSNAASLAVAQTQVDIQQSTLEEAKKAQDLMGKQVNIASESFKKASDEFPTGWDIMGQQIVQDLAAAATSALNQAIPALLDNLNPIAKAKAGASAIGGIFHGGNDEKADTAKGTQPAAAAQGAPQATTPASQYTPQKTQDPAYSAIIRVSTFLAALNVIIAGKDGDGNIDWDKAHGDGTKESGKSSIAFLLAMLNDARDTFAKVAIEAEPSTELTDVLKTCAKIASEIEAEVKKSSNASSSYPAKDSKKVKKWREDFAKRYATANALSATAKTLPGTAANGIPLMADPAVQTAHINAKTAQAQAVLESAKNRLTTTQQMLTTSQDSYIKTTAMLLEQQNKLGEIQGNLKRLTESNLSLTEIKAILIECIKLVVNLKQQISNLVRFFHAMSSIIETVVKFHVDPFLQTIGELVAADGTDPNKDLKIGNYTLTDLQRSMVFSAAVTLRSYFGVFGDIARMWVQLSKDNIFPGLKMCDELSVTSEDPAQMKRKVAELDMWSRDAAQRISQLAREKQEQINSGMEEKIGEVMETTNMITPPPPETLKAIAAGTEVTKAAAQQSIQNRSATSGLNRFGGISDDD